MRMPWHVASGCQTVTIGQGLAAVPHEWPIIAIMILQSVMRVSWTMHAMPRPNPSLDLAICF